MFIKENKYVCRSMLYFFSLVIIVVRIYWFGFYYMYIIRIVFVLIIKDCFKDNF